MAFFGELGGTKQFIMEIKHLNYEVPEVEIVEVEVERGFEGSQLESPSEGGNI